MPTARARERAKRDKSEDRVMGHRGVGSLSGPNTLYMGVYAGEATRNGKGKQEKFTLLATLGGNPVIEHGEGEDRRGFCLTWQELVELAIDNGVMDKSNRDKFK